MQLKPPQLPGQLSKGLARCYLIAGDEPLLVQEAADAIRASARAAGCTERTRISINAKDDWQELGHSAGALSLFADRKLIEVQLSSGKPGAEGSKALLDYLETDSDDVLLIISGRIDRQSQKSKWFSALERSGVVVLVWPVSAAELPGWMGARMKALGLTVEPEALALLAERMEGNLLAAAQEIEKLRLLHGDRTIDAAMVAETVSDNARYDAFRLVDVALSGDRRGAIRTLRGLRAESVQPPVLLWALAREIRLLTELKRDLADGTPASRALNDRGVWRSRQPLLQEGLRRLNLDDLMTLQELSFRADGASKGYLPGAAWDHLESLVSVLSGGSKSTSRRV